LNRSSLIALALISISGCNKDDGPSNPGDVVHRPPRLLGLAAETNLIRRVAPQPLYEALVRMTNDAAGDLRAAGSASTLYISVQVDVAWGGIINNNVYLGVEDDFRDFRTLPVLLVEGGWTSGSVGTVQSSPDK